MGEIQPTNSSIAAESPPTALLPPNPQQLRVQGFGSSAPCPQCGGTQTAPVGFTWWGGVLGPRIFHVVRCTGCRLQYNGQSGGRLGKAIAIYTAIAVAIAGSLFFLVR